jgi:hypothetical protein
VSDIDAPCGIAGAAHDADAMVKEPLSDSTRPTGRRIFTGMPSRRRTGKDTPAKLAKRMKRRWRVVLLRAKGELLGYVDAHDAPDAETVAAVQFGLDAFQSRRLLWSALEAVCAHAQ